MIPRYVFDFMEREEQREKFPQSNLRVILDKVGARLVGELKALMARFMAQVAMEGVTWPGPSGCRHRHRGHLPPSAGRCAGPGAV